MFRSFHYPLFPEYLPLFPQQQRLRNYSFFSPSKSVKKWKRFFQTVRNTRPLVWAVSLDGYPGIVLLPCNQDYCVLWADSRRPTSNTVPMSDHRHRIFLIPFLGFSWLKRKILTSNESREEFRQKEYIQCCQVITSTLALKTYTLPKLQ